jgi:hypothetical protein
MTCIFRREDNGELIELDFATVMAKQKDGFVQLDDGVLARRCIHLEQQAERAAKRAELDRPIISETLGFTSHQLAEMEADRKSHGFRGVEFIEDKDEPNYYNVKCDSPASWRAYMAHRGLCDRNGSNGGGASLSPLLLERAKLRVMGARLHSPESP